MQKIIKGVLLSSGLLPLFVFHGLFSAAVSTKVFLAGFLVSLAGVLFLIEFFRNDAFKKEILEKTRSVFRSPIFIALTLFLGLSLLSVFFANDSYLAFWGEIERGEGFAGIATLFGFFILTALNFEKKDWLWFFKITLLVSLIVLIKEFWEFAGGNKRPDSFIGNPTFLAGYLLFSMTSAILVFKEEKNKWWDYFAIFILLFSIIGIFLTQTRGTILGLFFSAFTTLLYFAFKGKNIFVKKISLQKIAVIVLVLGIIFSGIFLATRKSDFWQNIPGLSRVAQIDNRDNTTQSRLFVWDSALRSVNPKENPKEFFVGWGMENVIFATNEFYNPKTYKHDQGNFDRTHNKFLDVLVMSGIFALLAYLAVWFFLFRFTVLGKDFSRVKLAILFFTSSLLVHLIVVFDQLPISIMFFAILSFVFFSSENQKQITLTPTKINIIKIFFVLLFSFILFVFLRSNLVSFVQMKIYSKSIDPINMQTIDNISGAFSPFSPAQSKIRQHFLETTLDLMNTEGLTISAEENVFELFNLATIKVEEYIEKKDNYFKMFTFLAAAYNKKFELGNNIEDLKMSEYYMRKILLYSPERQESNNNLIFNLIHQDRFEEALVLADENIKRDTEAVEPYFYKAVTLYTMGEDNFEDALYNFEKSFNLNPRYFKETSVVNIKAYGAFVKYFYNKKDKERFTIVAERLKANDYKGSDMLDTLLDYIEKGSWPIVDFK